jgi:TonB family protein
MDHTAMSNFETEHRPPRRRIWILAAVLALLVHAAGAAAVLANLQIDDAESELGAQAIEVGLVMSSPRAEPTNLSPGPDTEASVASPALPEQKVAEEQAELPKDVPTETEHPDRVVALNEQQTPKEDDPKVAQVQTPASPETVAQQAMATPSVQEAPEGASQAPVQGIGDSLQHLQATWNANMSAHFKRHLRAPDTPRDKNVKVVVKITVDRLGHIVSGSIAESSGDPAYDKAALAMLRRSDPVPKPPPLVADAGLTFRFPVLFSVAK